MSILQVTDKTEFITVRDIARVSMTGGKFFLGMMQERRELVEAVRCLPAGCNYIDEIGALISEIIGYAPLDVWAEKRRKYIDITYTMPIQATSATSKELNVILKFYGHPNN